MKISSRCKKGKILVILSFILCIFLFGSSVFAEQGSQEEASAEKSSFWENLFSRDRSEWGGYLKHRFTVSQPASGSLIQQANHDETLWDHHTAFRLFGSTSFGNFSQFEVHNESFFLASDTLRLFNDLQKSGEFPFLPGFGQIPNDRAKFMDLTWTMRQGEEIALINRFDRLSLAFLPSWGVFKIGRQAITWGNGLLFNPFDIFTPFAPTAVDREYKQGEDAASLQVNLDGGYGDFQLIYVPRRETENRELKWEESSLAGKYHLPLSDTEAELTLIGGYHFEDAILGAGIIGYLGGAAWRFNLTWTYLDQEKDCFFSLVANMDYGWVWWGLNFYGWVEYYYNGLGKKQGDYAEALYSTALRERLERGEIFVRGRHYMDTQIRTELHPLLNLYLVTITNPVDPSGIVQPYLTWDIHDNLQFNLVGTLYWGARETEFGGVELVEGTDLTDRPPNSVSG